MKKTIFNLTECPVCEGAQMIATEPLLFVKRAVIRCPVCSTISIDDDIRNLRVTQARIFIKFGIDLTSYQVKGWVNQFMLINFMRRLAYKFTADTPGSDWPLKERFVDQHNGDSKYAKSIGNYLFLIKLWARCYASRVKEEGLKKVVD